MKYEGGSARKQGAIFLSQWLKLEIKKLLHQIQVVYGSLEGFFLPPTLKVS